MNRRSCGEWRHLFLDGDEATGWQLAEAKLCKFSNLTISLLILFWIINGFVYCLGSYILIDCRLTASHETIYQLYFLIIETCSAYEKWRTICSSYLHFIKGELLFCKPGVGSVQSLIRACFIVCFCCLPPVSRARITR